MTFWPFSPVTPLDNFHYEKSNWKTSTGCCYLKGSICLQWICHWIRINSVLMFTIHERVWDSTQNKTTWKGPNRNWSGWWEIVLWLSEYSSYKWEEQKSLCFLISFDNSSPRKHVQFKWDWHYYLESNTNNKVIILCTIHGFNCKSFVCARSSLLARHTDEAI